MGIDWIPVRKITAKDRGNRGFLPSRKNPQGVVEYESQKERNLFLVLEHAPDVRRYQHQPKKITYADTEGKTHSYTPDVFIEFINGKEIIGEVKLEEDITENGSGYQERWDAANQWAKNNGSSFVVISDKDIETPRWANIWFTLGASKCSANDKYMPKLSVLIPQDGMEYNPLCYRLAESLGVQIGKAAQIICYAIYHGLVFVDTFSTNEISRNTIIRRRTESENSPFRSLMEEFDWLDSGDDEDLDSDVESERYAIKEDETRENDSTFTFIPEKYREEVEKREKIVKAWLQCPSSKRTQQWRDDFQVKWDVKVRTVYRWIELYEKRGLEGLIPAYSNAGRSTKYGQDILELFEEARRLFLKPGVTLKEAHRKLEKICGEKNLPVPPKSTFQAYIYQNTTASEKGRKRGRKYHKSHYTPSLASFQGAFIPMQIIQMDNTSFDVFPVDSDKRESLSTPYMTAGIDCCTKMITGYDLSFFPSSSQAILEVLVQSILPKEELNRKFESEHEWPIQGFPVLILVDNGMDYRSKNLRDFCVKYDIIVEYVPIRTPRYKAFIEQWFNVLRQALKTENVPGHRPLLRERIENPELKPEAEAVCTLQDLEKWLHRWVIDEYHFSNSYDDHVLAPFLKWKEIQDGRSELVFPLPREPPKDVQEVDMLNLSTLDQEERTLKNDGIVWEHLKYNSKALSELFSAIGEGNQVKVMLDRRDIRRIWVINPVTEKPMRVGLASGWAQAILALHGDLPIHASAWKKDVQNIQKRRKEHITPYIYQRESSRVQRDELLKNAKKETKTVRKENEKMKEAVRKGLNGIKQDEDGVQTLNDDETDAIFKEYTPEALHEKKDSTGDVFEEYKPQGLVTSKYPQKKKKED